MPQSHGAVHLRHPKPDLSDVPKREGKRGVPLRPKLSLQHAAGTGAKPLE